MGDTRVTATPVDDYLKPESAVDNNQLETALTQLLYKQNRPFVLSILLASLMLVLFSSEGSDFDLLVVWFEIIVVVGLLHLLASYFFNHANEKLSLKQWNMVATLASGLMGVTWGAEAFFWNSNLPLAQQFLLVMALLVISVLAISANAQRLLTFAAFIFPGTFPIAGILLVQPEASYNGIGFLLVLYPLVVFLIARNYHNAITSALSRKFENDALVDRLNANVERLEKEIGAHEATQLELEQLNENLEKRVTERTNDIQALYSASAIMALQNTSLHDALQTIASTVLPSWLDPKDACAEIVFDDQHYQSEHFYDGERNLIAPIFLNNEERGHIKVVRRRKLLERADQNFVYDEKDALLNAMARDIASNISYRLSVDEQKNMEIQLRQAQKLEAVGQLAAGIAHEINTPAQFVSDNLHFLKDSFADYHQLLEAYSELATTLQQSAEISDGHKQTSADIDNRAQTMDLDYLIAEIPLALEQSQDGMQRIEKIVKAMKEFSHPGSDIKTPTDINHAIETTIEVSRNEWKYHAELETDLDPQIPLVPVLPGEINQVILNIIVNAAQAIPQSTDGIKGLIKVSTVLKENMAVITISDNGNGIPADIQKRVFDPFFTTKEVGKGTGQGLAIAWSVIVDKHHGDIKLESEESQGTTFIISLPLTDREPTHVIAAKD